MASGSGSSPLARLAGLLAVAALALPVAAGSNEGVALLRKYQASAGTVAKAVDQFRAKDFARAERGFRAVLLQVPDHHQARYFMAQLSYLRGDYPGALRHIATALASLDRMRILYASVQAEDQRQAMDQLQYLETMRSVQESWHPKTRGCGGTTLLFPVDGSATHGSGEDPFRIPAAYHLVHGNVLLRLGRHAEAEASYRRAVGAEPYSAEAWNNLVGLLLLERKIPAAQQALDQARGRGVLVGDKLREALAGARDGVGPG